MRFEMMHHSIFRLVAHSYSKQARDALKLSFREIASAVKRVDVQHRVLEVNRHVCHNQFNYHLALVSGHT